MKTSLDFAISIFEKQRNESVFSIRPVDGLHQNDSFIVNMSTLVQVVGKDPLALPMNAESPEWAFYRARSQNEAPCPCPHFFSFSQPRHRIEPYIYGRHGFENVETKEKDALEIIHAIAAFHQLPYATNPYPLLDRFRFFKARSKSSLPTAFENQILTKVDHLLGQGHFVLCHHQLKSGHIIMSEEGPVLLDYEMVGMDCPLLDLASLVEENELDSPLARRCLSLFNSLHPDVTYSYEDLEALVIFFDAYWHYRYAAYYELAKVPIDAEIAKRKKERFLFAFKASLMGEGT